MGRTKRIRNRRKESLAHDKNTEIIALMRWMALFNWKNTSKIFCKEFDGTGRGVSSIKNIISKDTLIEVPYELLITYSTLCRSIDFVGIFKQRAKLGIHDVMAAFLTLERHRRKESDWKYYLDTLPDVEPMLPWFSTTEEINHFPEELRKKCLKCKADFEYSLERIQNSLNSSSKCKCCAENMRDILSYDAYRWGYVMVNTRSVYIDPVVVKMFSNWNILYDEPRIAMFPLMDMFNHSDVAENIIKFRESKDGLFYQLSTLDNYKKHNQIFISYGSHDNTKLFTEYGFYLPKNMNDKISFSKKEILVILDLELNNFQYEFLKKHQFLETEELFITSTGPSFKLKGFVFVALNNLIRNYSSHIFSENYGACFLEVLDKCLKKLLDMRIAEYEDYISKSNNAVSETIFGYIQNKIEYAEFLKNKMSSLLYMDN